MTTLENNEQAAPRRRRRRTSRKEKHERKKRLKRAGYWILLGLIGVLVVVAMALVAGNGSGSTD